MTPRHKLGFILLALSFVMLAGTVFLWIRLGLPFGEVFSLKNLISAGEFFGVVIGISQLRRIGSKMN